MTREEAEKLCKERYGRTWAVQPVRYIVSPCTFDPDISSEICKDKAELEDAIDRWIENEIDQANYMDEVELRVRIPYPYWAAVSDDGSESVKLGDMEDGEEDE